jgi:hypothetical protein
MADANTALCLAWVQEFGPLLSGLRSRFVASKLLMKSARKAKSLHTVVAPGRRDLIVCFLQLLLFDQNRVEMQSVGANPS